MTSAGLQPLGFGELLDRTFIYYRKWFWLFVGIMAIPQIFAIAMSLFQVGFQPGNPTPQPAGLLIFVLGVMTTFLLYFFVHTLAFAATTFAVSEVHTGRGITIRAAYQKAQEQVWRLLRLFLWGLLLVLGCAITIVLLPVAALMPLWYALAVPVLLLEHSGVRQALKRSRSLTKDQRGRIFLIGLLTVIVSWVLGSIIQGPFVGVSIFLAMKHTEPPYWLNVLTTISGGVAGALTGPLFMIALVLLYYDVRVRKEGYDVQLMLESLGGPTPAADQVQAAVSEVGPKLKKRSVLLVFFLTLITLGLYYPIWFLARRKALNDLHSSEELGLGALVLPLVLWIASLVVTIVSAESSTTGPPSGWGLANLLDLIVGIILLVQTFKVRRILLEHHFYCLKTQAYGVLSSSMALQSDESFSSVLTFFGSIFYLQYKINRFLETTFALAPPASAGPAATRAPTSPSTAQ